MKPSMSVTLEKNQRLEQIANRLIEAIDNLQLSIQYLVFDLEATKREKQQLRQRLASLE